MTSTTKHCYDYPIGKCANKENESTNGKRNELSTKSSSGIDSNFDWSQKEAIHQQRKLRLVEVRQQSKDFSSQILENVRHEEERQLERINRIKQEELFSWRQKQISNTEKDLKHCLSHIGEAHLAAERENTKQRKINEQHQKNRQIALKRGKLAAEKIKADSNMKSTTQTRATKAKTVIDHSKRVAFQTPETSSSSDSSTSATSTPTSSSSNSSTPSVILVETKKKPEIKMKKIIPVPSKSAISPKANKSPIKIREYNPMRYTSANNSSATDVSMTDNSMSDTPPLITKVSDLLGKKSPKPNGLRSSPYIAKTYKLDKSPVSSRNPVKRPIARPQINSVSSRLSRTIQTPTKSSGKSPVKMLPERKDFVPEFVKTKPKEMNTKKDTSVQTTPKTSSKVQFYDHANKFASEYESNIDLEERLLNIIPLNAWDEAKQEKYSDMLNKNEQYNLRMLAENRARVALEKEKIRKDYEKMSSQLSEILNNNELANSFVQNNELLSKSRLRQINEEREQLMNKEFRSVLKASAVITCPKVNSTAKTTSTSTKHRPKAGEVNVAQKKANNENNDISTDSTHSFLLDCMTERTNTICDDINRCRRETNDKNQSKIEALHELLNQVNVFRRVLCDEIKLKNGDLSTIDANQFLTEIEKVGEKQHKIMQERPTHKTDINQQAAEMREKEFKERERLLKLKESCINDKVRELYLLEKKIDQQKKQPSKIIAKTTTNGKHGSNVKNAAKSVSIVTSNGAQATDDIPVRIVINVNKNEHGNDNCTDVVVNDVKWCDKLAKSNTLNGHIESVPVANGSGKIYPKTPAKTKVVMEKRQMDILSQSSTSITAYLSPPDQIRTSLTKAFNQRAGAILTTEPTTAQQDNNNNGGQISDTELLHYIIRMMGMSRTSIQQLNMSSVSSVPTPNSSVVNVRDNCQFTSSSTTSTPKVSSIPSSIDQIQSIDRAKLQQLARYLAENNQLTSNASQNNKDGGLSGVWDDILSKKTDPTSRSDNENSKSIKRATHAEDSDEKLSRGDLIAKYDELAANCTKRIINLDSMISKVREEKLKLLENTLSSASSLMTGQKETTTEYKNYAQPERNQQLQTNGNNTGSPLSDSKGTHAPSSDFSSTSGTAETSMPNENRGDGLFMANKNKPFAESKDSGVGNSRPVTSSDYRDSPDLKQTTKQAAEQETGSKLLQSALRESKRDPNFEPMLKDLSKIDYRIRSDDVASHGDESPGQQSEQNAGRDKIVKQTPPVAMIRFSPHLEDELPHELSTITEVDTPATSRLNATDMTNLSETTLRNGSVKLIPSDVEAAKLQYNVFPTFKDYIKSNTNISAVEDTIDLTIAGNTIPDERLSKMLEPHGSRADELKYKPFAGETPENKQLLPEPSEPHLSYTKFPSHAEYAKGTSGLLDSQSIDQLQNFDENDSSSSSLPDIVSELKQRNILEHSFQEAAGDGCDFDDLLLVHGTNVNSEQTTVSRRDDESFSDTLEQELNSMGLKWVTASLKKMKLLGSSTSTSTTTSDSSNFQDKLHRSKPSPPAIKRTSKRTYENMNEIHGAGDSFVDKNLVIAKASADDRSVTQTQASNSEGIGKQINLKEFMARELLKHSSVSSSSDSSLASMFLKSFLGQSAAPGTPPNNTGLEKHRTSTPIESIDNSTSKGGIRSSSSPLESKNDAASRTFFPNDSTQLSSVRFSTGTTSSTSTSAFSDDRHK